MAGSSATVKTNLPAWQAQMAKLAGKDFPAIVAKSINQVAERAHMSSIINAKNTFKKFNRFSAQSMRFYKANPKKNIFKINAIAGSRSEYLKNQDMGGTTSPRSGHYVPVPTLAARRGSVRNSIQAQFRLDKGRKSKFFVLNLESGYRGLFYRRAKWQRGGGHAADTKKIVMLRALNQTSVKIKPMRWHTKAMKTYGTQAAMNAAFARAMRSHGH